MTHLHDDARTARFRAMTDDDPENELAWFSLGQALFDAGRFADALTAFAHATRLQDDLMMAHLRQAQCLCELGRPAEARPFALKTRALAIAQNHEGPREDADDLLEGIDDTLG